MLEPRDTTLPSTLWRDVVERLPAVVYLAAFDDRGTLTWLSPAAEELFGLPAQAFLDDDELWYRCIHPDDVDRVRAAEARAFERHERFECEYRIVHADGSVRAVLERDRIVYDDDGCPAFTQGLLLDVTRQREAEARAERLAEHDELTGLPNRVWLQRRLRDAAAQACRGQGTVVLLELDLDDFALVNDSLGHHAGDRLLAKVAARLASRVRAGHLLARSGGDTFAILLVGVDEAVATAAGTTVAQDLLAVLDGPFELDGTVFHLSACAGFSVLGPEAPDADALQRTAGAAVHAAKQAGRGSVRRFDSAHDLGRRPLSLTARLRRAMDHDELELHWQPIVDPADGRPRALEALARWQDPDAGLILPGEFIGFAEETGLIERLDGHLLELACAQAARWRAAGLRAPVTVNVSARAFASTEYAGRVAAAVAACRLPAGALVLELTETSAMRVPARTSAVIAHLAELGVEVAIDDFGAGYSSLARLLELPVRWLKVDRTFLAHVPEDPQAAALLDAITGLVRALARTAIVEGVETEAQREHLLRTPGLLAQGFLLGEPVPAGVVDAWLAPAA